ncbi:4-(cytidine 5'-diphospho)-2-C-methyl-D-erythritol kinase [Pseudotabrizicola sp. L79]|uniref:4-(cytidine 5'-diphospho)-2-C-methyl-D-erythritol kinase n=1 Tax=Pseudotabrizicola sp. L79 TaxID=3118402 RepID=UPI002F94C3C3
MISEFAPAKINLTLHVTGQRADGYHLLDSLVVFADVGDRVSVDMTLPLGLHLTGPMADGLTAGPDNLVLRAARLMGGKGALALEKHLPVSSGIGGGSADAAATLRLLARLSGQPLPERSVVTQLGADVPVCLQGRAARMSGVGDQLDPVPPLPEAWLVLVNPRVAAPTPAVFKALTRKDNAPMPRILPRLGTVSELADFVQMQRNDLEPPATALAPVIGQAKALIRQQPDCLVARMSGSGATCFGLFADGLAARAAAHAIQAAQPGWWAVAARMLS